MLNRLLRGSEARMRISSIKIICIRRFVLDLLILQQLCSPQPWNSFHNFYSPFYLSFRIFLSFLISVPAAFPTRNTHQNLPFNEQFVLHSAATIRDISMVKCTLINSKSRLRTFDWAFRFTRRLTRLSPREKFVWYPLRFSQFFNISQIFFTHRWSHVCMWFWNITMHFYLLRKIIKSVRCLFMGPWACLAQSEMH